MTEDHVREGLRSMATLLGLDESAVARGLRRWRETGDMLDAYEEMGRRDTDGGSRFRTRWSPRRGPGR